VCVWVGVGGMVGDPGEQLDLPPLPEGKRDRIQFALQLVTFSHSILHFLLGGYYVYGSDANCTGGNMDVF
jgi:hypothetical protein